MRLTFSVLWFDDNEDYFDSLNLEPLENEIASWGFEPSIIKVITPEEFNSYSPFQIFDLIVVDQNLENYDDGQEFIANLRGNAIYTEVIFYTAGTASDLWDAIREKQLEGVFVSSKNGILDKIITVGRQSIRKVLDLENMRGIVMAEVGELDHLLDEIITLAMNGLSIEQQNSIFQKFCRAAEKQHQDSLEQLSQFVANPEVGQMLIWCDSENRWRNLNRLRKTHDKLRNKELGDYSLDVLTPRNFLAHGQPEFQEDGSYLFHYQGREFRFDEEVSSQLRKTILSYKIAFSEITRLLKSE